MVLEESANLTNQTVGAVGGTYLEDGRFAYALVQAPEAATPPESLTNVVGTYLLTSLNETPQRVNILPLAAQVTVATKTIWAKDGSGALLVQEPAPSQSIVYYAPTSSEILYEITAVLGQTPHSFQWQPEIIVP